MMTSHGDEGERLNDGAKPRAQSPHDTRRSAEEELREQSELFRITLASIGDAVISTDAGGRVAFMNGVAEALTGWTLVEAHGRDLQEVFQIINEQTRDPVENPAIRALKEGTILGLANDTVLIARDGTERPIADSAAPIRDESGTMVGSVLVFRDVTEHKRTELLQARLAAIVESSEDAIVSKTLEGIIQTWNQGAERLFGYTPQEAIGQSINLVIPQDRRDEELEILARIARGDRLEHFDTVRVRKDGRPIHISLSVSPIRDGSGRIVGASKIARDVSERKRAEAALREADRRKDQFIALLAHELRNPLAPIRSGLQVMRLAEADLEAVAEARDVMERQLEHMVRLIDDLLDISRISQNRIELRRSRVLLRDVVNSAVETSRPLIDEAHHELMISLPPEPVYLDADLTRMSQVLSNLLTNSVKYTDPGGRIWLTVECHDDDVSISVRDNGIGIPRDSLLTVFDMFSQVDQNLDRSTGGLGIGLALVKGLVEMHGGTVTAASDGEGKGSTFTIDLPILHVPGKSVERDRLDSDAEAPGPGRRILVVDDNRDSANCLAMMLKLKGNEVRTAYSGKEAIKTTEAFLPNVIFMDIGMPELNGYEATQCIREQPWGQKIIIISLTGWGQESDREQSNEAGCDGHLVKPVSLSDLLALLNEFEDKAETAPR